MTFKPFSKKYDFVKVTLIKDFPSYLHDPIGDWLWKLLCSVDVVNIDDSYMTSGKRYVKSSFINNLQIDFREEFPRHWNQFVPFLFSDSDRICNFLAYCLQHFTDQDYANRLEYILSQGGSGYGVIKTDNKASEYDKGVYSLVDRVADSVVNQSKKALSDNELLMEAWVSCYARNHDYEKVVIKCQNFLEDFLRDTYEPSNTKPQLGKLVGNLKNSVIKLDFKGDSIISDKKDILSLIDNIPQFRGMHTAGTGKTPTREEAEYVLHTTIYVWNLHQN